MTLKLAPGTLSATFLKVVRAHPVPELLPPLLVLASQEERLGMTYNKNTGKNYFKASNSIDKANVQTLQKCVILTELSSFFLLCAA